MIYYILRYHHCYSFPVILRKVIERTGHFRSRQPLFLPPRKFRCAMLNNGRWQPRPRDQKHRRHYPPLPRIATLLLLIIALIA